MPGLVNLRAAEAGLWAKGAFVTSRTVDAGGAPIIARLMKPEVLTSAGNLFAAAGGIASGEGPILYNPGRRPRHRGHWCRLVSRTSSPGMIDKLKDIALAIGAFLVGLGVAFWRRKAAAQSKAKADAAQNQIETRERMDDADVSGVDPAADLECLRDRSKR